MIKSMENEQVSVADITDRETHLLWGLQ